MIRLIFSITLLLSIINCYASDDTMNGIFAPSIHTLQVKVEGNDYAPPIITLNSDDRIIISFDELSDDVSYMRYSLTHCDRNWHPSGLVDPEFIDGFNQGDIDQYEFSQMTSTHYVHYSIALPNDRIKFTISGNYLLKVFPEDNPEEILLQARFMVSENSMAVSGDITSRTDIDYNNRHQQLSIAVDTRQTFVHDIYNDLSLNISQNNRCDNAISINQPMRVAGKVAHYEHKKDLIFEAGNEYRRMEIISTSYPGMRVAEIGYAKPFYHMTLETDKPRYADAYSYDQTQHGHFTIREYNSNLSDIEADYIVTLFTLEMPELINADIFLDGEFTHRRFDPQSRMIYNNATSAYEKTLLLKQGAYNYQYLMVPTGSMRGKTSIVEGDFYQTINQYLITVYHRIPGSRYDRLTSYTVIYSGR